MAAVEVAFVGGSRWANRRLNVRSLGGFSLFPAYSYSCLDTSNAFVNGAIKLYDGFLFCCQEGGDSFQARFQVEVMTMITPSSLVPATLRDPRTYTSTSMQVGVLAHIPITPYHCLLYYKCFRQQCSVALKGKSIGDVDTQA